MKLYWLVLALASALPAQTLEGVVVDRVTNAPVAGAYVRPWTADTKGEARAIADVSGRFRFESLPAESGVWKLSVGRSGYLSRTVSETAAANASVTTVRIELTPQAVISGKVEDEDGFPVPVNVMLLQYRLVLGKRELQPFSANASTNDLGEFRLAGVAEGSYYLRVSHQMPAGGWDGRYADEYYPGVITLAEAKQIEVQAGKELSGVHMKLKRREGHRIAGRLVLPPDMIPNRPLTVVLTGVDDTLKHPRAYALARPDLDWYFTFRHVQPGEYDLSLQSLTGTVEPGALQGRIRVNVVGEDLHGVALRTEIARSAEIQGKVVFEGGTTPRPMVVTIQGNGTTLTAPTSDDGTFVVKDVKPGHYDPRIADASEPAEGHRAQLVFCRFAGQALLGRGFDVNGPTDGVLEIHVAENNAELSFRVLGASPEAGAYIYVRGMRSTRFYVLQPSTDDVRRIFVLPGFYRVFASPDALKLPMADNLPFLQGHRKDIAIVRAEPGQNPVVDLRLISR